MFDICCCVLIVLLILLCLFFILMLTYIKPNIGNEKVKITRNDNINSIYRKITGGQKTSINQKKPCDHNELYYMVLKHNTTSQTYNLLKLGGTISNRRLNGLVSEYNGIHKANIRNLVNRSNCALQGSITHMSVVFYKTTLIAPTTAPTTAPTLTAAQIKQLNQPCSDIIEQIINQLFEFYFHVLKFKQYAISVNNNTQFKIDSTKDFYPISDSNSNDIDTNINNVSNKIFKKSTITNNNEIYIFKQTTISITKTDLETICNKFLNALFKNNGTTSTCNTLDLDVGFDFNGDKVKVYDGVKYKSSDGDSVSYPKILNEYIYKLKHLPTPKTDIGYSYYIRTNTVTL